MVYKGRPLWQLKHRTLQSFTDRVYHSNSVVALFRSISTMPKIPQRLAATPALMLRQRHLAIINRSTHHIFSLDPDTLSLTTYYWYVASLIHPFIDE